MTKSKLFTTALALVALLCCASCEGTSGKELGVTEGIYELAYRKNKEDISVDVGVTFVDLSLGIVRREWYLEDANPQTSISPEQLVVFKSRGLKKCSLTVHYNNGTSQNEAF